MTTTAPGQTPKSTIDLDKLFEKLEFVPHSPAQWEYCRSDSRFSIPCCGRRWGKSQAAGHRMTAKLFTPDTYNWIVGPTYRLGEKEFRVVFNDLRKLGVLDKCRKSYNVKQGDMRIQTPWNSILEVVSADRPDSLVGEGLDHAIMSEAALHPRIIWEQYIEPALSDKRGTADFPSTPRGYNWYHGLFNLGQSLEHPDYTSWSLPTWTNSARFPGGFNDPEIVRIRALASKQHFDQEYGALFTSFAGQIYDEFDSRLHVIPITFNPGLQNFLVFDYGFANPFVALDIQVDQSDNVYVWREYYVRHLSTYEHGVFLKRDRIQPPGYHVDAFYGDPRGADEAATLALVLGYVEGNPVPWKHGVEAVKRLLKIQSDGFPKLFIDPSCTNLIRQMEQLHIDEKKRKIDINELTGDGNIQHKVDDHSADALRYFVSEFYVLGASSHLADVYDGAYRTSESADFFRLHSNMQLDHSVRF